MRESARKNLREALVGLLAVAASAAYPCLFMYFQNAGEARLIQILPLLGLLTLAGAALAAVLGLMMRNPGKGALVAAAALLLFVNFRLLQKGLVKLIPWLHYWHVALILLLILGHVAYFAARSRSTLKINLILGLVFVGLIAVNGVTAAPTIIEKTQHVRQQEQEVLALSQQEKRPNVYYMIFDEYANFDGISHYYGYDNQLFLDFLTERRFNISQSTHNSDYFTMTVVPDLLNLDDVVNRSMPEEVKMQYLENPKLYQLLQAAGYQRHIISAPAFLDEQGAQTTFTGNEGGYTERIDRLVLANTAWYPFMAQGNNETADMMNRALEALQDAPDFGASNQFTLAYFSLPHADYVFDEDGNLNPTAKLNDWEDRSVYLGQFKYTTKRIMAIVDEIVKRDPDSVIIIQSDHGCRPVYHQWSVTGKTFDIPQEDIELMRSSLNVVYYRGEPLQIEGLSGVNTLRAVMNQLLGTDYPMLPDTYDED